MSGSTLPQAFGIVRNLLAERPRAFQELLRDGISSASTSSAAGSTLKGKGKLAAGETLVPDGHPFVSANYLKTRVLPILSSQGLITKSTKTGYALAPETNTPIEGHWDRLLAGESPSALGWEHSTIRSEIRQARAELRAEAHGEAESLMWYRSGKPMGKLAAPLDRGFLNRRNSKKRVRKDLQRAEKEELLAGQSAPWEQQQEGSPSA